MKGVSFAMQVLIVVIVILIVALVVLSIFGGGIGNIGKALQDLFGPGGTGNNCADVGGTCIQAINCPEGQIRSLAGQCQTGQTCCVPAGG